MPELRYGTGPARWVLLATVLGSGMVFLDGTVVNIAIPAIGRDLHAGISGVQWVLDAYLVVLSALLLLGGSLGDRYGRRRVFLVGLVVFTTASVLCGVAPDLGLLIAARALEGAGGALLVPGSLAILSASFQEEDRRQAIGAWSGLAGISSAIAPLVGGWLTDSVSWRAIFFLNVPLAVATVAAMRHVPETRDEAATGPPERRVDGGVTGAGLHDGRADREGVVAGGGGRRPGGRVRGGRAAGPEPDAAARGVPVPPVHRGQPDHPGRLRRAGRLHVPGRAQPRVGHGLLGGVGRRRHSCRSPR